MCRQPAFCAVVLLARTASFLAADRKASAIRELIVAGLPVRTANPRLSSEQFGSADGARQGNR
ncbi:MULTISPECIES: hypothetical protein [unclassified Chelatococcus]|uniref:hypothetical protein n=1 Tax=unclassified Chelatococcus TaxID=2638111 RepID=UPI001BCB93D2|nr:MULTISPECIES: hypothetical protein [unclassified Chelatococcus]MBS7700282.1 hypothetical protein [Chelatococcus sp. YT9]MBX3558253.1 hypothetical protein [Chelatococcus sp.]